ncbi:MAG: ParB/RepB/Spo0J family partition protein [Gammaproteobacteria bacterium]|nr:ParB/RepB/Spo0J family partition protein [Gammaproteobacteria bacterium]MDA7961680.1 ParB/RepB/Spo0J family partition protein [Gammaproteobacteria bacterium]MDA7970094.1 ParB/RepB/Spo0J family partition protein [Gammaproteobacteria bacterium]MDA8024415.1 ParB/RepB/Spo0J family partition protein [Gammaproteobacteria bacterium]CAJ2376802.1 MAG: putative chromosome-partitioning protein ParB [Arenicellales bacterium IbO2]
MTKKKKARLGRGLGALLGDVRADARDAAAGDAEGAQLMQLPIEQLQRGKYQPRAKMDRAALEELAASISAEGVLQPILARRVARGRYEIVAGERRWRGAQLAGLRTVPAVVRAISDRSAMAVALIENIQREDLGALEEAAGFQRLLDEFGLTHQEIADTIGRSRASVTNLLRLLALAPEVKKLLAAGKLEMGHARALLALPSSRQLAAARKVIADGLTVRGAETLVKRLLAGASGGDASGRGGARVTTDVSQLEERLSARLGARVSIQHRGKNGKVVIHYHSPEELEGILARIK